MTAAVNISARVLLVVRRWADRKTVMAPVQGDVAAVVARADLALVKALARGFRY